MRGYVSTFRMNGLSTDDVLTRTWDRLQEDFRHMLCEIPKADYSIEAAFDRKRDAMQIVFGVTWREKDAPLTEVTAHLCRSSAGKDHVIGRVGTGEEYHTHHRAVATAVAADVIGRLLMSLRLPD
jgi:hypothetical protein